MSTVSPACAITHPIPMQGFCSTARTVLSLVGCSTDSPQHLLAVSQGKGKGRFPLSLFLELYLVPVPGPAETPAAAKLKRWQQPLLWLTVSQALSWSLPGVVETSTKGHLTLPLLNGVLGPGPGLSLTWGHRGCCMVGLLLTFSSTKLRAATGRGNVS